MANTVLHLCVLAVAGSHSGADALFSTGEYESYMTGRGPLFGSTALFNPEPDPGVPDPPNVVEGPNWLIATSGLCACEYTVVRGDSCWSLTQDFGVEYSAIVDGRTSQACPDAVLWEGDPMCITAPTKGQDKCAAAPTPEPTPTPV